RGNLGMVTIRGRRRRLGRLGHLLGLGRHFRFCQPLGCCGFFRSSRLLGLVCLLGFRCRPPGVRCRLGLVGLLEVCSPSRGGGLVCVLRKFCGGCLLGFVCILGIGHALCLRRPLG